MSVPDRSREAAEFAQAKSFLLWIAAALVLLIVIALFPMLDHLLLGWIPFMVIGLAGSSYHSETILLTIVAAVGFAFGLHQFLVWLSRTAPADDATPQRTTWHWRSSAGVAILTVLLFVSGTAVVGLIHQVTWLTTTDRELYVTGQMRGSDSLVGLPIYQAQSAARQSQSRNNLKQIGLALHNYASETGSAAIPPGGIYGASGQGYHGWMTLIMPYIWYYAPGIALDKPWTAPENVPYFQSPIREFRNPAFSRLYDEKGYALTHYAGNVHVLYPNSSILLSDVRDGTSQTILSGEVNDEFVPWGSPGNFRDPAKGINRAPDGFGGAGTMGAQMLFIDGSVKLLSKDTDPAVLRALSTPTGNDHADGFD